jgi:hypothetical protein
MREFVANPADRVAFFALVFVDEAKSEIGVDARG